MNNMNLPNPENRHEIFLASAAGMNVRKPEPITREEIYLNAIASGSGGDFDPDSYYTKPQTDARITEKVAEIVADAPEDFDTLKEISDWISSHEDSAAAMNSAIRANTTAITGKVDKVSGKGLSTNDYTTAEKEKLAGIATGANKTVIDSALNSSSTNPVQNKVIKKSLDNKVDKISGKGLSTNDYTTAEKTKLAGIPEIDTTPTENSNNLITSGGVYTALQSAGGDNFSVIEKIATPSITLASGQMQTFDMWIKGNEVPFSNVIGTVGAISRTSGVLVAGSCLKGPDPLGTGSYVSYTVYNITDSPISEWQANIYILVKS